MKRSPAATKEHLLAENARLEARVNRLESELSGQIPQDETRLALRERVKELDCLYALERLREKHFPRAEAFLQAVADRLPESFLLSDQARARVRHGQKSFVSPDFQESRFRIAHELRVDGRKAGVVEVFYRRLGALPAEGPFLPEESKLMEAVADRVSRTLEHMQREMDLREAHRALQYEHHTLQETNTALRTVMNRLEQEKREIQAAMLKNIQNIVMPVVFELELQVSGHLRAYVSLLRQNLNQITDSFLTEICQNHVQLSPVEIVIATMIRNGLSTKEIARVRCISQATVRRHRENIRRKLGLTNRKANLVTYLQSGMTPPLELDGPGDQGDQDGDDIATEPLRPWMEQLE